MISQSIYATRLLQLRALLATEGLDALIVSRVDEHLSDYIPKEAERLSYISGFTGSAGTVAILKDGEKITAHNTLICQDDEGNEVTLQNSAALVVDGRYTLQARVQTDHALWDSFHFKKMSLVTWLRAVLKPRSKVGIDPKCISHQQCCDLRQELKKDSIELVFTQGNIIDRLKASERDAAPEIKPAYIYEDKYNGCPSVEKRKLIARKLRDLQVDATILTKSESVNWLLNVRGHDVPNLPVVNSFAVVYSSEHIEWFVDLNKIPATELSNFQHHFGKVDYYPESGLEELTRRLGQNGDKVYINPNSTNAWLIENLSRNGATLIFGEDLCELPKACKNQTELAGMKKCHQRDAVAMCRFLAWLDHLTEPFFSTTNGENQYNAALELAKKQNEQTISDQLYKFRAEQEGFLETSFDTISALGPNASIIHYNHKNLGNPRPLGLDPLYLVDSGGQYVDGTTDITRTILVGPGVTEEMKTRFTLVLKGLIALHRICFPLGTYASSIDVVARAPLWQYGLNYDHGTGHGVGHCLNVHEGPQAISPRGPRIALKQGMVTSVEPGYYKDNEYGIRCENLSAAELIRKNNQTEMLTLAPITFVPFDLRLINKDMLTENERTWINDYHFKVRELVKEHLSDFEISWLLKATAAF